jgi:hypothetical protein
MQSKNDNLSDQQPPPRGLSFASVIQFLGASSIIAIATWSLNNIISAKGNQQQQLNTFINTISDFMIQNNLDGQSSGKPEVPAVTRACLVISKPFFILAPSQIRPLLKSSS